MKSLVRIENADDPRIAAYLNIRDRDIVGRLGSFVAEGSVVLRKLLGSVRYAPQSALILENRLAGLEDVIDQLNARNTPVYVASSAVIDAIAGFPMHRGVLAIGSVENQEPVGAMIDRLPPQATIVVCVGISNHDNMGAIFRNAAGFGADAVFYDTESCDPLYRKAIRVSVGSVFETPHARVRDIDALMRKLAEAGFQQIGLTPSGDAELYEFQPEARSALYLGTEGEGLPPQLLDKLIGVRIGMREGFDSLNVATACAIALYQFRSSKVPGANPS